MSGDDLDACVKAEIHRRVSVTLALVLALTSGFARPASAQRTRTSEREDLRVLGRDGWFVITSPARVNARAVVPIVAAVGATVATVPFDSSVYAWMKRHPRAPLMRAISPIREDYAVPFYELGSALYLMPISGALYLAGRLGKEPRLRDAGLGCAASVLASSALRVVVQLSVSRERPRQSVSAGHLSPFWQRRWKGASFPSGHVANPMACATFLEQRFALGVAEPALYGTVAMIGLGRVADGQHWPSDVVAGAAIGFAIGRAVAARQHHRIDDANAAGARLAPIQIPVLSVTF